MKNNIISISVSFVFSLLVFIYVKYTEKKMAFISVGEVYNSFEMKKEFEAKFLAVHTGRKQLLDSLEVELNILSKKIQLTNGSDQNLNNEFEMKKENYLLKKQGFEEDNEQMKEQYTANIMKQMNQYVQDYGKEFHYSYILGAEGSGSLMYGEEMTNVTKDMIQYINLKYKGEK